MTVLRLHILSALFSISFAAPVSSPTTDCPTELLANDYSQPLSLRAKQFRETYGRRALGLFPAKYTALVLPRHVHIKREMMDEYLDQFGNEVEILVIPGDFIYSEKEEPIRKGHNAVRIGGKVFHLLNKGSKGIVKVELLDDFLRRYGDHRVYGYVIETSPQERAIIQDEMTKAGVVDDTTVARAERPKVDPDHKPPKYNLLKHNCASSICKAFSAAGIVHVPWPLHLETIVPYPAARLSGRLQLSTVYQPEAEPAVPLFAGAAWARARYLYMWMGKAQARQLMNRIRP